MLNFELSHTVIQLIDFFSSVFSFISNMEAHPERVRGKKINMTSSARQKRIRKSKCDIVGTSQVPKFEHVPELDLELEHSIYDPH